MKKKHVTINRLIEENGYKSYLEIGYGQGVNYKQIVCENKHAIDPETVEMEVFDKEGNLERTFKPTSDEWFEVTNPKTDRFDMIFIDGLHHSEQVEKDIANSWKRLKLGGMILVHDCKPFTKEMTERPRTQEQWTGDVFRAVAGFQLEYGNKIETRYYPEKYGLFAIIKNRMSVTPDFSAEELYYEAFIENVETFLNMDEELIAKYS